MEKENIIKFYLNSAIKNNEDCFTDIAKLTEKANKIIIYILASTNLCISLILTQKLDIMVLKPLILFCFINIIMAIILILTSLMGKKLPANNPVIKNNLIKLLKSEEKINIEDINYLQTEQIKKMYINGRIMFRINKNMNKCINYIIITCLGNFILSFIYYLYLFL